MVNAVNRILVIDDDRQVRESVSRSLEMAGYTVMVAGTSQEGFHRHEKFQTSLIIMAVVALADGEDEPNRQVPHQFFQQICTLQKPFTVDELLQAVQRVLAH